jgi:Uma2 family endonuclease
MSTAPKHRMTAEEYLAFDRASDVRHEFYRGELFAMSGARWAHNLIAANLASELHARLKGHPCRVTSSDTRVLIQSAGLFVYPDIVVTCGTPRFLDNEFDTLLNPTLLIEVLSDSTEQYDRVFKAAHYQRIESLRTYCFVSQRSMTVEWFTRAGDQTWTLHAAGGPDGVLDLPDTLAIPVAIPLAEIYERVDVDRSQAGS